MHCHEERVQRYPKQADTWGGLAEKRPTYCPGSETTPGAISLLQAFFPVFCTPCFGGTCRHLHSVPAQPKRGFSSAIILTHVAPQSFKLSLVSKIKGNGQDLLEFTPVPAELDPTALEKIRSI